MRAYLADLADFHWRTRDDAARALARIGAPAVPALARLAAAPTTTEQRAAALDALHGIGTPALATFQTLLAHPDPIVRHQAIAAFGRLRRRDMTPTLRRIAASDPDEGVRGGAVGTLALIGGSDALALFKERLATGDLAARSHAVSQLHAASDLRTWAGPLTPALADLVPRELTSRASQHLYEVLRRLGSDALAALPALHAQHAKLQARVVQGQGDQGEVDRLRAAIAAISVGLPRTVRVIDTITAGPALVLSPATPSGSVEARVINGGPPGPSPIRCAQSILDVRAFPSGGELDVTIDAPPGQHPVTYLWFEVPVPEGGFYTGQATRRLPAAGGRVVFRHRFATGTQLALCGVVAGSRILAEREGAVLGTYRVSARVRR